MARVRGVGRIDAAQYVLDVGRRRVEGEQRVRGVVVAIVGRARQRDALLIERVAQLQRQILAQGNAEARRESHRRHLVSRVAVRQ